MTDSANSYAIFTYKCGDLRNAQHVSIGFGTEDGLHAVHEALFRGSGDSIACLNYPNSPWTNVVYEITNNGKIIFANKSLLHVIASFQRHVKIFFLHSK